MMEFIAIFTAWRDTLGDRRRFFSFSASLLFLAAMPLLSAGGEPTGEASIFAGRIRSDLRHVLYAAALLDPDSGEEDSEAREARGRRQSEMRERLGRNDQTLTTFEIRAALATVNLLDLPVEERLRALRRIDHYLDGFARHFAASLVDAGIAPAANRLPYWLLGRLRTPVHFQPRHFPGGGPTMVAAMYYQPTNLMLINLDVLVECPDDFIDSFEHELWHHLLPIPEGRTLADNLWWEGCNEAVAELWGHFLHRRLTLPDAGVRSVEYPVDTAFASWLLAVDRAATIQFMAGAIDRTAFLTAIESCPKYGSAVGRALRGSFRLCPERRMRVESLLHSWRWRAKDGTRVSIAHLLDADGAPDPAAVERAFSEQRRLLMDVIQAWSVVLLQDLKKDLPANRAARAPQLPVNLRRNLRRVVEYARDPYYQLANR